MRLNPDFVQPKESVRWTDDEGEHIFYNLASSLDDFVLSGSPQRSFSEISQDPKNHLLILGVNNISSQDVMKNLDRYKLTVNGLIVPEENSEYLQHLVMGLPEVRKRYFKSTPFLEGQSFVVTSRKRLMDGTRTNYVISSKDPKFHRILKALDAPKNLILN